MNRPSSVPHCAGRWSVAHPRVPMVPSGDDWRCVECGEEYEACQEVIVYQNGEPVVCGAAKVIHGPDLGMVGGHAFVSHSRSGS